MIVLNNKKSQIFQSTIFFLIARLNASVLVELIRCKNCGRVLYDTTVVEILFRARKLR